MNLPTRLPEGAEHVRTTRWFTATDVPQGLLREHQLAERVWGRLVVESGSLRLVFDDHTTHSVRLEAGGSAIVPPERIHHVEFDHDVVFAIEIHRSPS